MPAPLVEEVVIAPSPRHVYVRGHWRWSGSDWMWVHGQWVLL
ncbi:MAG: YXWGXW repeat-containing protein [Rhizobacter sp.]|nr:YXWGXW repeat-containing protein [Rhizobacter sp.]